jgi:hypothetical protein
MVVVEVGFGLLGSVEVSIPDALGIDASGC